MALCLPARPRPNRAAAQTYPDKPIRIIVPAASGGPTDLPARLASQILQPKFGQPVVIENRPGAGGAIGARAVIASPPDGYTLLAGNTSVLAVYPAVVGERRLRSGQELRAGRQGVRELSDPGGERVVAVEDGQGAGRRFQGQSRQAQLRAHRRRRPAAPDQRTVRGALRRQASPACRIAAAARRSPRCSATRCT